VKLRRLEAQNQIRRQMAARYDAAFAGFKLELPRLAENSLPNRHLYVVRIPLRDDLRR